MSLQSQKLTKGQRATVNALVYYVRDGLFRYYLDQINLNVLPTMPRAARLANMQGVFYSKAGSLYAMHHKGGRMYFTGATAYANSINTHQYNPEDFHKMKSQP